MDIISPNGASFFVGSNIGRDFTKWCHSILSNIGHHSIKWCLAFSLWSNIGQHFANWCPSHSALKLDNNQMVPHSYYYNSNTLFNIGKLCSRSCKEVVSQSLNYCRSNVHCLQYVTDIIILSKVQRNQKKYF